MRRLWPWWVLHGLVVGVGCWALMPAAARTDCVSIGGVRALPFFLVAGETGSVQGPITNCSGKKLVVKLRDSLTDACGNVWPSRVVGDYHFAAYDESVYIALEVPTLPFACAGVGDVLREVYGPGGRLLAAARASFVMVKP